MTGKWVTTLVPEPAAGSLPHGSPGDKPQDARERGTMREKTPGTQDHPLQRSPLTRFPLAVTRQAIHARYFSFQDSPATAG